MVVVVSQSVVLGYLTDYFSIQDPSAEDTWNAYLYALGMYHTYHPSLQKKHQMPHFYDNLAHTCPVH